MSERLVVSAARRCDFTGCTRAANFAFEPVDIFNPFNSKETQS